MSDAYIGFRSEYSQRILEESDLKGDPIELLASWIHEASEANVVEPTAMTLATATADGHPSARIVLLRRIAHGGLVFFTNYASRKGGELTENPNASVCFWWGELERQVRVEGTVARLSAEESDDYFRSRPLASQAASAASPQSQVIENRSAMEAEMARLLVDAETHGLRRPDHWGGYLLTPTQFEFWQGRKARLHDRFRFQLLDGQWKVSRLAP